MFAPSCGFPLPGHGPASLLWRPLRTGCRLCLESPSPCTPHSGCPFPGLHRFSTAPAVTLGSETQLHRWLCLLLAPRGTHSHSLKPNSRHSSLEPSFPRSWVSEMSPPSIYLSLQLCRPRSSLWPVPVGLASLLHVPPVTSV